MNYSIVVGASGVMGENFAVKLAKQGQNLYITGRTKEKLELLKCKLICQIVDSILHTFLIWSKCFKRA